jgi:hypothetical protein
MHPRYHQIEEGLWDDDKFDARGDLEESTFEERAFFCYLASNTRQRPSGIYRVTDEQLSAGSRLPIKRVILYLQSLHLRRLIVRDGAWIFLPGYLKRQSKNERLLIGVQSDIERCTSIYILNAFGERYPLFNRWSTDRLQTINNPCNEILSPHHITSLPNQPTPDNTSPRSEEVCWPHPKLLITKYNKETPDECPSVESVSPGRIKKAKQYLEMFPAELWWTETFKQFHQSRWLRGLTNGNRDHPPVARDFDWLLSKGHDLSENAVKVHDGRYRDG